MSKGDSMPYNAMSVELVAAYIVIRYIAINSKIERKEG